MHEILLADRVKGEREIAVFRLVLLVVSALMVLLMVASGDGFTLSDNFNLVACGVATLYTIGLLVVINRFGYKRIYGWLSSTVDVLLVAGMTYLSRYAAESSVASLVSTSSFAVYFPIILFSVRRHDPANTLFTGIFSALTWGAMVAVMAVEDSFWVSMRSDTGLVMRNDLFNEALKGALLALTGVIGWGASRRFDRLFEETLKATEERSHIRNMFGRYVSEELVDKILSRKVSFLGERREATVMFIDIQNFTSLAERSDPRTLIAILNNFFNLSINVIAAHGGFIDKFIGDAIMVVFGAPEKREHHAEAAIECAKELSRALSSMNAWVHSLGVDWEFGYGIGINSGEVVVGNVGTERRMEYTALGDTVNVASRLEHLTRTLGHPIVLGESCVSACGDCKLAGPFRARLKGKSEPVIVYAIPSVELEGAPGEPIVVQDSLLALAEDESSI
ncbi:MAG: adenylate/guanylate cyclase domain-containing protein [Spirochaetia bacterium]|nr:adenylate/guanylate cyclase domain-containing protein [Spirochaetia bacterium]